MAFAQRRYLVDDGRREREAVRTLLDLRFLADHVLCQLGVEAEFAWFLLDVNKNRLQTGGRGDVDILAGRMEWIGQEEFNTLLRKEIKEKAGWHPSNAAFLTAITLASRGGLKWPPPNKLAGGHRSKVRIPRPTGRCDIRTEFQIDEGRKSSTHPCAGARLT